MMDDVHFYILVKCSVPGFYIFTIHIKFPVLSVFPLVPCNAINIRAYMDCENRTAVVSWWPSDGAFSYIAMASTKSGHNVTCETNMTYCDLTELLCGQSYSVSVKAIGKTCSSIAKMTGQLVTGEQHHRGLTNLYSTSFILPSFSTFKKSETMLIYWNWIIMLTFPT